MIQVEMTRKLIQKKLLPSKAKQMQRYLLSPRSLRSTRRLTKAILGQNGTKVMRLGMLGVKVRILPKTRMSSL